MSLDTVKLRGEQIKGQMYLLFEGNYIVQM